MFTPELADTVIRMIEEGATLREVSAAKGMPSWPTIRKWIREDDAFATRYARAREVAADAFEARIFHEMERAKDGESAAVARVRIDALKWIMAKRAPRAYGDMVRQELSGPNGGPIQTQQVDDARPPIEQFLAEFGGAAKGETKH